MTVIKLLPEIKLPNFMTTNATSDKGLSPIHLINLRFYSSVIRIIIIKHLDLHTAVSIVNIPFTFADTVATVLGASSLVVRYFLTLSLQQSSS